jgi:HEAT repeat protein
MTRGRKHIAMWRAAALAICTCVVFDSETSRAQELTREEVSVNLEQLRNGSAEARANAAEVLGRRAHQQRDEVQTVLRQAIREDADWRVRASAGRALGRLGTRDAMPDLVRALRDPVVDVRVVAAAAIWRLPDPAAVPALLELLRDPDGSARQWSALALGVIRDLRATEPLIALLEDPEGHVRMDVLRSLGRIRDPRAAAALEAHARNTTRELEERVEAVSSLAGLDGPSKVEALLRLLALPTREVRQRVIESLGQVGDALVIPQLRDQRRRETGPMRHVIDEAVQRIERRARGEQDESEHQLTLPP